jgi:pimeloyl-ACP methyl ester carboxylesterase
MVGSRLLLANGMSTSPKASERSPSSIRIDVGGVRIHCLRWASPGSTPIVIVHGNTHCGGLYSPLASRLAADHDVTTIDLRGHGRSDDAPDYGWLALQEDIAGVIRQLALENPVIIAHSRGAGVSLLAMALSPSLAAGAVVFEPTMPLALAADEASQGALVEKSRERAQQALARRTTFSSRAEAYAHYRGRGSFRHWQDEYLRAFIQHGLVETDHGVALASDTQVEARLVEARRSLQGWDSVQPCHVPVRAVYGDRSGRLGPGLDPMAALRRYFPRASFEVMPDASHSGPMEHPEAFERLVRAFLGSLPGPAAA